VFYKTENYRGSETECALMPRSSRRKFKGIYQVVFDGSGTIDQDRAVVYAGALSSMAQWQAFTETWEGLLAKHDLAYLKFAEADTFFGEFVPKSIEWATEKEVRRDAVLGEFAALKDRYAMSTNGCGFVMGINRTSPFSKGIQPVEKKKEQFQCAILALLNGVPADHAVSILCDVEKDTEDHYRGWIEGLMRVESEKVARIVQIAFADDMFSPPIQFADLIAGVTRQELERRLYRAETPVSPLYELLSAGASVRFEPIGPSGLLSGVEIQF
jgi:hypothetical protein